MKREKPKLNWDTTYGPPMITVEPATDALWRVIVFEQDDAQRWSVAEILECNDPAYWVERMFLPEDTLLRSDISSYDTGRARKLSSRVARIVQQKQKELT